MLRAEAAAEGGSEGQPVEGAAKQDSDSEKSLDLEVESVTSENTVSLAWPEVIQNVASEYSKSCMVWSVV